MIVVASGSARNVLWNWGLDIAVRKGEGLEIGWTYLNLISSVAYD